MADPRDERNNPQSVLSGFLTESTRRVRRTLLAVTTVAIGAKVLGVHLRTLSLFGNTVEITNERWLPIGLFVAVAYFWGLFVVYGFGDAQRFSTQIWAVYSGAYLTPENSLLHRRSKSAAAVMTMRVVVDLLVPILYAGVGLILLLPLR